MRSFRFYKDSIGWFIDIPEWNGNKSDLQMVSGADTFCELLSPNKNEFYLTLSTLQYDGFDRLVFTKLGRIEGWELGEGAWYFCPKYNLELWLCNVTKFLFDEFPKSIFFKI